MAITAYNLATFYSLEIKPDFTADTLADVTGNEAGLAGKYILVRDQGDQIFYVQDDLNGEFTVLPAYDLDNYNISSTGNRIYYREEEIVPSATEEVINFVPTSGIFLDKVFISSNGDGEVSVSINNVVVAGLWMNWQNSNVSVDLGTFVEAGDSIIINIKCNALGSSKFKASLTYR